MESSYEGNTGRTKISNSEVALKGLPYEPDGIWRREELFGGIYEFCKGV